LEGKMLKGGAASASSPRDAEEVLLTIESGEGRRQRKKNGKKITANTEMHGKFLNGGPAKKNIGTKGRAYQKPKKTKLT